MKAEELMKGDWVYLRGTPCRVKDIVDDGVINYEKDVTPIPLTPEILEKNGFEHESNAGYVYEDYSSDKKVIVELWDFTIKILHNYDIVFNYAFWVDGIKVHKLQHLLKDLEIEKEIIL